MEEGQSCRERVIIVYAILDELSENVEVDLEWNENTILKIELWLLSSGTEESSGGPGWKEGGLLTWSRSSHAVIMSATIMAGLERHKASNYLPRFRSRWAF